VILEKTSVVVPDLLFVSRDRLEKAQLRPASSEDILTR